MCNVLGMRYKLRKDNINVVIIICRQVFTFMNMCFDVYKCVCFLVGTNKHIIVYCIMHLAANTFAITRVNMMIYIAVDGNVFRPKHRPIRHAHVGGDGAW